MNALWQWLSNDLWRYSLSGTSAFSTIYHWFNVCEGVAWCAIGILAWRRYLIYRKSLLETAYGLAFVTFGLSDFVEAYALTMLLILGKGANLLVLVALRRFILRYHYPGRKTF